MRNFDKVLKRANEIGVNIKTECSPKEKGLFFKNEDGELIRWDYHNEFKTNSTIDNENYLTKANNFYKNEETINKSDFYKNDNGNSKDIRISKIFAGAA
ncbi:hypothetical protein PYH58_11710 [Mammaliicoccus sciuri]|uniref:hypothetical protein n=1 Tax=Mammaliicoccus sciuri TaxID=1296 RepID=UPI0033652472